MITEKRFLEKLCKEYWLIENYDKALNDKEHKWVCHHRREVQDGFQIWSSDELKKVGQYYNRPANELIFLKREEHRSLHNKAINPKTKRSCASSRNFSDDSRKKISMAHQGKKRSVATRKKISIGNQGKKYSTEIRKKMSISHSSWVEKYGYTLTELEKILPLTMRQICYKDKHHPDELKKIIKETIGE